MYLTLNTYGLRQTYWQTIGAITVFISSTVRRPSRTSLETDVSIMRTLLKVASPPGGDGGGPVINRLGFESLLGCLTVVGNNDN